MCGIWATIGENTHTASKAHGAFCALAHRGPDAHLFHEYADVSLGFHRLAIVDPRASSNQPFVYELPNGHTLIALCNGEIYNYKELFARMHPTPQDSHSDCAVIPHLYQLANGDLAAFSAAMHNVRGEFAFLLFEFTEHMRLHKVIAGRDEIGIRPLYMQNGKAFSSEMKGLDPNKGHIREFPPGEIWFIPFEEIMGAQLAQRATIRRIDRIMPMVASEAYHLSRVRTAVLNSVRRRLTADRPIAFLLSGGVDSSLVAALSSRILGRSIRTFCCGMEGGTDLAYARKVAAHIRSEHTEVIFTPEEGLAAIDDVIRTVESWDITTIRASVGQYLVSKWVGEHTDARVLLVGEGPDEVCSSYLFNWYAPSAEALDQAARDYVENIHYYDVKRADRCVARWGLEARVPLLDPEFIEAYWAIPAAERMPQAHEMEKWWFRKAFKGVLPAEVLWRKKEAFSDGVSSQTTSWFQTIQKWVEERVSNEEFAARAETYPVHTPPTKEALYYRKVFESFYPNQVEAIPGYWQPKWANDGYVDPSARVLSVYPKSPSLAYANPDAMEQL